MNRNKKTTQLSQMKIQNRKGNAPLKLKQKRDRETSGLTLRDILVVPDIESQLMSVTKGTYHDYKLTFENNTWNLTYNGQTFMEREISNNIYQIHLYIPKSENYAN